MVHAGDPASMLDVVDDEAEEHAEMFDIVTLIVMQIWSKIELLGWRLEYVQYVTVAPPYVSATLQAPARQHWLPTLSRLYSI